MDQPQPLLKPRPLIGRSDSQASDGDTLAESVRWIGKPWRRLELVTRRYIYRGVEQGSPERDLTLHVSSRRLRIGFTLILMHAGVFDYSGDDNP